LSSPLLVAQSPPIQAQGAAGKPVTTAKRAPEVAPGDLAIVDGQGRPVGACPLKHTDVSMDVSGFVSRVTVKQQFQNPSKTPIEAVYTFPLPADAAVDDMQMTLGDRTISGRIKRKEEARKIYEAARSAGQTASLLDQERPNIFTQSVANVMPGQSVTITLSYSNLLKYDDGAYELTFPMVVGPRNTSQPSYDGAPGNPPVQTDGDKISPPITPRGTRAGHDISLSVKLDAGLPLQEVKSQLHEVIVDRDGPNRARIRLRDENSIPNKDFILRYKVGGAQMQTGVLAHSEGNGSGYFTLILQPPAAPTKQDVAPKEMVFVIDQTGSQNGEPIKKAKETMKYCLENLNPGDTFQLIGFNTQVFPCFEGPVPLTEATMKQALAFLEPIQGNGGTDILKSVDYVLKIPADPKRLRMICYMTDGYVGNDMQVLDYIRKNRGQARMFVFGIGNSVNRFLIDGMAKEGRGASEIVDLKMPGEQAASRFYARVHKPILLDPQVEFGSLTVEDVFPKAIPDVFSSGPIILKGRYKGAPVGDVTVSGMLRGQPWSQKVHVTFPAMQKENTALPTLWAREKLEDLQSQDWLGAQSGNPDVKIKDQIVNLALDYRLMSQYTSFVAVEDRVVNVGGKQRRVDVPVEMPEGVSYEGIFGEAQDGLRQIEARQKSDPVSLGRSRRLSEKSDVYFYRQGGAAASRGQRGIEGFGGGAPGPLFGLSAAGKPMAAAPLSKSSSALGLTARKDAKPSGGSLQYAPTTAPVASPVPAQDVAKRSKRAGDKRMVNGVDRPEAQVARVPKITGAVNIGARGAVSKSEAEEAKSLYDVARDEPAALGERFVRNPEQARKELAALKPAERKAVLRKLKLAPALLNLAATVKKEGTAGTLLKKGQPEVRNGRALVQVWTFDLSTAQLHMLKALGFLPSAELKPKQLVLGTLPVEKLDALIGLPFVGYVDMPKFLD
jgi:Ca-activated chloride channel family protein